jgi:hypothetical protein
LKKLLISLFIIFIFTQSAFAAAKAEIYKNKSYAFSEIKTAMFTPIQFEASVPTTEAFFNEKVSQKWKEFITSSQDKFPFLIKSHEDVIERNNFVKGVTEPETLSSEGILEKALSLSDQYVDAILSATIVQCNYNTIHHPQEIVWKTRNERRKVKIKGEWEEVIFPVNYQEIKPAWDETFANASLIIELRDSKTNELIYGISTVAKTGAALFSSVPSLTDEVCNVLEYSVKRINLK